MTQFYCKYTRCTSVYEKIHAFLTFIGSESATHFFRITTQNSP